MYQYRLIVSNSRLLVQIIRDYQRNHNPNKKYKLLIIGMIMIMIMNVNLYSA